MTFVYVLATTIFCVALYALVQVATKFIFYIKNNLRICETTLASESFDWSKMKLTTRPYTKDMRKRTLFGLAAFYPVSFLTSLFLAMHLHGVLSVAAIVAVAASVIAGNSIVVASLYYDWTWKEWEERCGTVALERQSMRNLKSC